MDYANLWNSTRVHILDYYTLFIVLKTLLLVVPLISFLWNRIKSSRIY